jgi:septum site-determining protein MinD
VRVERGEMLKLEDIQEILRIPLLGVVPESESVLKASNTGNPVILDEPSPAGQAYRDAVARFLGDDRPMRFTDSEKKGFLSRLFGGRAA